MPAALTHNGAQDIGEVEGQLQSLARACDSIASTITGSNSETAALLSRSDAITAELEVNRRKQAVLADFLENYQLSQESADALRDGDIDDAFFAALARVRLVQRNCRALLHTSNQRAGLALLDSMAAHQELAHERLCKCVLHSQSPRWRRFGCGHGMHR